MHKGTRPGPHMWKFILNSPKAAEFDKKELASVETPREIG